MNDTDQRVAILRIAAGRDLKALAAPLLIAAVGMGLVMLSYLFNYLGTQKLWEMGVAPHTVGPLVSNTMGVGTGLMVLVCAVLLYFNLRLKALVTLLEQERTRSADERAGS
jgi:Flp pilus assembly protein protease CpaA